MICSNCWRDFPYGDWQMPRQGGECYACRTATVTPEARHQGFLIAMARVDTPTLERWVNNPKMSDVRREAAAMILRERHGYFA